MHHSLSGEEGAKNPIFLGPKPITYCEQQLLAFPSYQESVLQNNLPYQYAEYRELQGAVTGIYQGMKLQVGQTELHLREVGKVENILAAAILYVGDAILEEKDAVRGQLGREASLVLLLDNGVVSSAYINSEVKKILSGCWYPHTSHRLAINPYPIQEQDIALPFRQAAQLSQPGIDFNSKTFLSLPPLVMLAVESYKRGMLSLN